MIMYYALTETVKSTETPDLTAQNKAMFIVMVEDRCMNPFPWNTSQE